MLAGVNASDLEALLEFVYRGEVSVDHSQLPSLLQAAHCLNIQGLAPQNVPHKDDQYTTSIQLHPTLVPHHVKIDVANNIQVSRTIKIMSGFVLNNKHQYKCYYNSYLYVIYYYFISGLPSIRLQTTDELITTIQAGQQETVQAHVVEEIMSEQIAEDEEEDMTKDIISQYLPTRKRKARAKKPQNAANATVTNGE